MKHLLLLFIGGYRKYISPLLPSTCRFYPSCSQYALEAIQKYGSRRGLGLSIRRLLRCHPLCKGGYEPLK